MKTVTLQQLDPSTSQWLREASQHDRVIVTDHGTPLLTVTVRPPPTASRPGGSLANRVLLPEFAAIMVGLGRGGTDSTQIISEDRERGME